MFRTLLLLVLATGCVDDSEPLGPDLKVDASRIVLGPEPCGATISRMVRLHNLGDEDVVVEVSASPGITVTPKSITVPPDNLRSFTIGATIVAPASDGQVTLVHGSKTTILPVTMTGIGVPVVFDPPIVDFGNLLPSSTKEISLRATLGESADFAIDLGLGAPSTPRFEVVGPASTRLVAGAPATFTIRYTASTEPFEHTGVLPIQVNGSGSCTPPEIVLTGTTVP